jgi:hypothetical protein
MYNLYVIILPPLPNLRFALNLRTIPHVGIAVCTRKIVKKVFGAAIPQVGGGVYCKIRIGSTTSITTKIGLRYLFRPFVTAKNLKTYPMYTK